MDQLDQTKLKSDFHFNNGYREKAVLRDGHAVTLRLVRATDKELLRRGFERMSPESRYRRFFAAKKTLSDAELVYLTELDGLNHFAIAATINGSEGTEEGVGIARFIRSTAEPRDAEAAVAVVDDWQNRGLGSLLLARLVAAARERGIERFEARALADNAPLRDVLSPLGAEVNLCRDGDELVIGVNLPDVPIDPSVGATQKAAHHGLLSLAARGLVVVRRVLRNLEHAAAP